MLSNIQLLFALHEGSDKRNEIILITHQHWRDIEGIIVKTGLH